MKILLSAVNLPGSWLIRFATAGEFSHCDVLLDEQSLIGAEMLGGVKIRPIEERTKRAVRLALIDVEMTEHQETVLRDALKSQEGQPYDWIGIFGWFFRKNWDTRDAWFCSEYIVWAFREAHADLVAPWVKVKRFVPRDIYISPRGQLLWYAKGRKSVEERIAQGLFNPTAEEAT